MTKNLSATIALACLAAACASGPGGPTTSWGKAGVSMVDYRVDAGQCAVMAATAGTNENGAGAAGGLNGSNAQPTTGGGAGAAIAAGPSAGSTMSATGGMPTGSSMYRDSPPEDFTARAAMQQRTAELEATRARQRIQQDCLRQRGYREFRLTDEQRAHLATLPEGSDERRQYLYSLGADPNVLAHQGL